MTLTPQPADPTPTITVIFFPGAGGFPRALTVSPSSSNPTSTVPFAYTSGITTVTPTQQIQVLGTTSYFCAGTLGRSWLLVECRRTRRHPASECFRLADPDHYARPQRSDHAHYRALPGVCRGHGRGRHLPSDHLRQPLD